MKIMDSERIAHRVIISSTGVERRSSRDRRQRQISIFKKLFYRGLRESTRRAEDRNGIIVFDRYKPSLVVSIIIVLSLSLLDALLTLILLSHGAKELNPVMRYYLNHVTLAFIFVKYGLTVLPMLIILFAKEALITRYRINIGIIFYAIITCFGTVIAWELYLLSI
jgi:hypothetical protein